MSLLLALVVGAVFGGVAGFRSLQLDYLLLSVLVGVAGSVAGLAVCALLGGGGSFFSLPSLLSSIVGALLFLLVLSVLQRTSPKRVAHEEHVEDTDIDEDD